MLAYWVALWYLASLVALGRTGEKVMGYTSATFGMQDIWWLDNPEDGRLQIEGGMDSKKRGCFVAKYIFVRSTAGQIAVPTARQCFMWTCTAYADSAEAV